MLPLLQPKIVVIGEKTYHLSKFPATAGREIVATYPVSGLPKLGDYKRNEEVMLKLMSFVAVDTGHEHPLRLSNQALIDNHVPNWEDLLKIEMAMMEYNCSFFQGGRVLTFLEDVVQKLPAWISKILTGLSVQSSPIVAQPSTNSQPSTP